jgi:hypothetical protein
VEGLWGGEIGVVDWDDHLIIMLLRCLNLQVTRKKDVQLERGLHEVPFSYYAALKVRR